MNRSLKLSVLLALALGSSQTVALELGQIRVKSALGQPLVAEIPVTPESPADLRNLSARLASDDDFQRAGITEGRTRVLLNFSIVNGPGGSKLIRITSTDAINDPYLDLLVQVDNAAGKSVREYTILLDPPGMAAAPPPAAPAPAPAPLPRRTAPAPAPVAAAPAAPVPRAAAPAPAARPAVEPAAPGSSLTVQSGETLSAIAKQVQPAGTDLNQTLLALKQANPGAFYRDNINALKSGAVLRVPTADEARAMTVAAALEEVRRQNSDWRSGAVATSTNVADAATRATASSSPTAPASKRDDHLELLPSGEGAKSAAASRDLQRSQENLAALQQQGAELRSRLKDLEDINSKNERLLSLKDSEIAELQRKLAEARNGAPVGETAAAAAAAAQPNATTPAASGSVAGNATPAVAASTAASPVTTPASTATASTAMASKATAPAPVAASQPTPVKPATTKKTAPAKPTPATAEEPWYMQTWAWAAGAAAIVLLLLLALRGRRANAPAKASGASLADRFGTVPALAEGEADPDQDELLDQLAEHPDDINLHLELVSLYYHRRDVERFEAAAEAMYAHMSDPNQSEWQDVAAMGEDLVPGHPLFAGVDTSVPEAERAPLGGFNLDDYDADATIAAAVPPPMPAGPSKISEYHFDFNLTPRQEAARKAEAEAEAALHDEPEHAAGLDLDDGDALAESEPMADLGSDIPSWEAGASGEDYEPTEFSDDPIDTKLDLARAYLDMGDADGARAMLEEVLAEGSQPQRDTARRLLDGIV